MYSQLVTGQCTKYMLYRNKNENIWCDPVAFRYIRIPSFEVLTLLGF